MENVRGLLSMQKGNVIKQIRYEFENAGEYGYNVDIKILKASDFGVPQARERVIIIGLRKDLGLYPEYPEPSTHDNPVTVDDAIMDLPQISAGEGEEDAAYETAFKPIPIIHA